LAARRHFHWCLAAIAFPVVTLPFEWLAAYHGYRSTDATPDHRRWARLLLTLAAVDTIAAALVIALVTAGVWEWSTLSERRSLPRGEAARIGVVLVTDSDTAEIRIATVQTESAAERAGLRAGDVVMALEGKPIRATEDLTSMIRSSTPGVPRALRVRRAGEEIEVMVTPEMRPVGREPPRAWLEAAPTPSCLADAAGYARVLARWRGLWAGLILILVFWIVTRRARPGVPALWPWVVATLAGTVIAGPLAWWGLCVGAGGRTVAAPYVAGLAQSAVALLVGLVALRSMANQRLLEARLEPILSARRTVLLGFFYVFTVSARVLIFSSPIQALVHTWWPELDAGIREAWTVADWPARILLALTVVVVGPLEEEVLFRGVMLPRLAPWLGPMRAIVATSVIFAVLHEGFGSAPIGLPPAGVVVLALVLGWARLRSGGLAAPIAIHALTNLGALFARP